MPAETSPTAPEPATARVPPEALVAVHRACNLNCTHCTTRTAPDQDPTRADEVLAALDAAGTAGASQLTLSGGEPLLHPELPALIARARARGARRVIVETNGLLLSAPGTAASLRRAGLDAVRINLPALDPGVYARVTRRPGVLAHALRGAHAALAAGLGVALRVVVVPENVAHLEAMAAKLGEVLPRLSEVVFELPDLGLLPAGGVSRPELFVPYETLGPTLTAAAHALARAKIPARFAPGRSIPPCAVSDPAGAPALFTLRRGNKPGSAALTMAIEDCAECAAVHTCAGFRRDHARAGARPLAGVLKKKLLRVLRDPEEVARKDELVFVNVHDTERTRTVFLRVNYHCNQSCGFCYIDRTLPNHDRDEVLTAIERTASRPGAEVRVTFTGGEPTLNPHLRDYVARATELGAIAGLQTNAVRLADEKIAGPLFAAGLKEAFVSLHGATAAVGDAVTEAPGTWARTLEGIDRLVRAGAYVRLNYVMTHANVPEIPAFAELVASRWGARVAVTFSLAVPTGEVAGQALVHTPRMRAIEPRLRAGIDRLRAAGVSPTWSTVGAGCTVPPCTIDDVGYLDVPWSRPARIASDPSFVRGAACASCAVSHLCPGVREEYAAAYGTEELRPLRAPEGGA